MRNSLISSLFSSNCFRFTLSHFLKLLLFVAYSRWGLPTLDSGPRKRLGGLKDGGGLPGNTIRIGFGGELNLYPEVALCWNLTDIGDKS